MCRCGYAWLCVLAECREISPTHKCSRFVLHCTPGTEQGICYIFGSKRGEIYGMLLTQGTPRGRQNECSHVFATCSVPRGTSSLDWLVLAFCATMSSYSSKPAVYNPRERHEVSMRERDTRTFAFLLTCYEHRSNLAIVYTICAQMSSIILNKTSDFSSIPTMLCLVRSTRWDLLFTGHGFVVGATFYNTIFNTSSYLLHWCTRYDVHECHHSCSHQLPERGIFEGFPISIGSCRAAHQ